MGNFTNTYKNPINDETLIFDERSTFISLTPIVLFNIIKSEHFILSTGLGLGFTGLTIKTRNNNISTNDQDLNFTAIQGKFILDSDVPISNKVSLFSRLAVAPQFLSVTDKRKETAYKDITKGVETALIKQTITPKIEDIALTFGVRYKI